MDKEASRWPIIGTSLQQLLLREEGTKNKMDSPIWIKLVYDMIIKSRPSEFDYYDDLWLRGNSQEETKSVVHFLNTEIHNPKTLNLEDFSLKTLMRILLVYFQKLPSPLLTYDLHDYFLGLSYQEIFSSLKDRFTCAYCIISALPTVNRITLQLIIEILHKVYNNSSKDVQNNSIRLWGRAILLRSNVHDLSREIPSSFNLLLFLVQNYEDIFCNNEQGSIKLSWMKQINESKRSILTEYTKKVLQISDDITKWADKHASSLKEFSHSFDFINLKLKYLSAILSSQNLDDLTQLIDTYHLQRFYSYVLDFHSAMLKADVTNKLSRFMSLRRLRASFERLSLSMQYELLIFTKIIENLYPGDPSQESFRELLTSEIESKFISSDPPALKAWIKYYGADSFMVEWKKFIRDYKKNSSVIVNEELEYSFRHVLDDSDTGFVSIYKFGQFLKTFGPYEKSLENVKSVICEKWFHGYLSRTEAERLLEAYLPSTFLVRFSTSDPGSFAMSFKDRSSKIIHIMIEPHLNSDPENKFSVKEGDVLKFFPTLPALVSHYSKLLIFSLKEKMVFQEWFYGDLEFEETTEFLEGEEPGTFLIRFSREQAKFTVSFVKDDGEINNVRLDCFDDGSIGFKTYLYEDMDTFVKQNFKWFKESYKNDNMVSSTQEEDSQRLSKGSFILNEEEDLDNNSLKKNLSPSLGRNNSATLLLLAHEKKIKSGYNKDPEITVVGLMQKLLSNDLDEKEEVDFIENVFKFPAIKFDELSFKSQKEEFKKVEKKFRNFGLFGGPKLVKLSNYFINIENAQVNTVCSFEFEASTSDKNKIDFTFKKPFEITTQYFIAIEALDSQKTMYKKKSFRVSVVLYKPIVLKDILYINFQVSKNFSQKIALPVVVTVAKNCIDGTFDPPTFWEIPKSDISLYPEDEIGKGQTASVFKCNLFGALVAVKQWELGTRDKPPEELKRELKYLKLLRHDNLVGFVGATCQVGCGRLFLEFGSGGSVDHFLKFLQVEDPNNLPQRAEGYQPAAFEQKLQMSIDSAKGLLFLHDHNILHRDIKSLNLLIDKETRRVKVTDFGESADRDSVRGERVGTFAWMAPEVVKYEIYSSKADIFSFGLVLYEFLTEGYPVRGEAEVRDGKVPPIQENIIEEYNEFIELIKMCCYQNPDKRPNFFTIVKKLEQIGISRVKLTTRLKIIKSEEFDN